LNKLFSGLIVFAIGTFIAFSCAKPNEYTESADTETQSSIDIAWAVHILSDIDMIVSSRCLRALLRFWKICICSYFSHFFSCSRFHVFYFW